MQHVASIGLMTHMVRKTRPGLFLLDGPTGVGKSTVSAFIRREYASSIYVGAKFTDRPRRATDTDWEFHFVNEIPSHLREYAYTSVGRQYAIDIAEVKGILDSGLSYLVTCTDPTTTRSLWNLFPTVVIFIYRSLSAADVLSLIQIRRAAAETDVEARQSEVDSVLRNYAKNIQMYDFVVLNTGTMADLEIQVRAILQECGINPDPK